MRSMLEVEEKDHGKPQTKAAKPKSQHELEQLFAPLLENRPLGAR